MRINQNLVIRGSKVLLVPYRAEHVITYHEWMQDSFLQESTASDPLTLTEEYQMQQSWLEDDDTLPESEATAGRNAGMAGDVNLFFNVPEDRHTAEIEVMVAEPRSRGKGLAFEALLLFMQYAIAELGLEVFVAKIGFDNDASQKLFAKLGFREVSRSQVFREATHRLHVTEAFRAWLARQLPGGAAHEVYD